MFGRLLTLAAFGSFVALGLWAVWSSGRDEQRTGSSLVAPANGLAENETAIELALDRMNVRDSRTRGANTGLEDAGGPSAAVGDRVEPRRTYSVRLDELRTYCWDDPKNPSVAYAGEPLDMFAVRIPTHIGGATPFDFCIEELRFDETRITWGRAGLADGARSAFGLDGKWLAFSDEVTEWERPRDGRSFGGEVKHAAPICVKGTAPQVFANHYADYWGAAVGFQFGLPRAAGGRQQPYRPRFSSIAVVLRGPRIPELLTLAVDRKPWTKDNTSWCKFVR